MRPLSKTVVAALRALMFLLLPVSALSALPNLTPYQPAGWSGKIVVSKATGTNTDSSPLLPTDTLYVDWAVINGGSAATAARFYSEIYVDGVLKGTWSSPPPLNPNFYSYVEDFSIGTLPAGAHTVELKADTTGAIAESNESDNTLTRTITVVAPGGGCSPNAATLCLLSNRFQVTVSWKNQHSAGQTGVGSAVPSSDRTGLFWFFNPSSIELVVKMVDGRGLNGKFWVFYGALSDVEYTITVKDTKTGVVKSYHNAPGSISGGADTSAFSENASQVEEASLTASSSEAMANPVQEDTAAFPADPEAQLPEAVTPCVASSTNLCLLSNRFQVSVSWINQHPPGGTGTGKTIPATDQSGYFWFFDPQNVDLVVKIVDGRALNSSFWVFYGALSDVEYTITVTDTAAGIVRTYHNAPGNISGGADTSYPASGSAQFQIAVSSQGLGSGVVKSVPPGINCGSTCQATFQQGTSVTLSAAPASGSTFAGWTGPACGGTGDCRFVVASNVEIGSTFAKAPPWAGVTDTNGSISVPVRGTHVQFTLLDDTSSKPIAGLAVGFALDPKTESKGVLLVVDPTGHYSPRIVVLQGPPSAAASLIASGASGLSVVLSDLPQTVVSRIELSILPPLKTLGDWIGAVEFAAKAINGLSESILGVNLAGKLATSEAECVSNQDAMADIYSNFRQGIQKTLFFSAVTGELPGLADAACDLGSLGIDLNTVFGCGAPGSCVTRTKISAIDIYDCQKIPSLPTWPMSSDITDPFGIGLSKGSLQTFSRTDLGYNFVAPFDSNGRATVEVPKGNYNMIVRSPGYVPDSSVVAVNGDTVIDLKLDPYSSPPAGIAGTWSGSWAGSWSGTCTWNDGGSLAMTLTQNGASVASTSVSAGGFQIRSFSDCSLQYTDSAPAGTVSGTLSGVTFNFVMHVTGAQSGQVFSFSGVGTVSGNTMTGTLRETDFNGNGTFTLTRH